MYFQLSKMISQLSLWGLHWELTSIWSHEGGFAGSSVVRNPPANAEAREDTGSIPGLGRSPGEGNGNPLQYSCLENPMKRGAWWATVHGVVKSWRRLSDWAHMHASSWKLVAFTYFYQLGIWILISLKFQRLAFCWQCWKRGSEPAS